MCVWLLCCRNIFVALFFGSVYFHMATGLQAPLYTNRLALLFFCTTFQMMTHQKAVPLMFQDRLQFYRERGSGSTAALPFWRSVTYLQIPAMFIDTLMFSVILWSMAELSGSFRFFWGSLFLTSVTGFVMAQLVAAVSSSAMTAASLYLIFIFWMISFSGFLVFIPEFSYWLRVWAPYTSYLRWCFQGLVLNEFDGNDSLPLGQIYINNLGFSSFSHEHCVSMLPVFLGIMCVLTVSALHFISFERR